MKTFEDFSRKNIDIDPYGEDDWDEVIFDWNKIKIVRPTKNDIGKSVMISPDSNYYCEDDDSNPMDIVGVIDQYTGGVMPFGVQWSNSTHNSYSSMDLTLIDNNINEGYFSDLKDYYNIFGFKSLLTRNFSDKSNFKKK